MPFFSSNARHTKNTAHSSCTLRFFCFRCLKNLHLTNCILQLSNYDVVFVSRLICERKNFMKADKSLLIHSTSQRNTFHSLEVNTRRRYMEYGHRIPSHTSLEWKTPYSQQLKNRTHSLHTGCTNFRVEDVRFECLTEGTDSSTWKKMLECFQSYGSTSRP